jgi:hypothetical protein
MGMVLSSMLLAAPPVQAQRGGGQPPQITSSSEDKFGPTLSVNFGGGTLESYLQALQKAAGDKAVNVVVSAEAKKVELPPIVLRDVTLYTALSAVEAVEGESEHNFGIEPVGNGGDATFAIRYARRESQSGVFVPGRAPGQLVQVPNKRLEVYSIRDLIEPPAGVDGSPQAKVAYESILSAVDAAMGMFGEKEPPKLLFHKETGLLLVSGTQYQTETVDKLIGRIRDDLQRRWGEERSTKKQSAEQSRRAAIAKSEMQISEKELALAEEQLERAKKMMDQGVMSREEFNQAQIGVDRARAALERKKIELDAAMEMGGDAGKGGGADAGDRSGQSVVVYDISDLAARDRDVASTMLQMAPRLGAKLQVQNNSLVVSADDKGHELVRTLLETMRKVASGGAGGGAKGK